MKVEAIIPTAGLGLRFGAGVPKTSVKLRNKSIFIWTLETFEECNLIDSIILVVHKNYVKEYKSAIDKLNFKKVKAVIAGGKTRFESVKKGLGKLDDKTDIVVIHDGARPLIEKKIICDAVKLCKKEKAVIVAVPVKPTIKRIDNKGMVQATLDREKLWEAQTPQVFNKELITRAYKTPIKLEPTDDSMLVENLGFDVKVLKGSYSNIKITTKEDLVLAESFLREDTT